MKCCNKCGKKLKDNDIICSSCRTKTDINSDIGWLKNETDSASEITYTANNPAKKPKNGLINIMMIIGIIFLVLLIIFIIAFIWQGFIDASNI